MVWDTQTMQGTSYCMCCHSTTTKANANKIGKLIMILILHLT